LSLRRIDSQTVVRLGGILSILFDELRSIASSVGSMDSTFNNIIVIAMYRSRRD
jgi:hypothetical protein